MDNMEGNAKTLDERIQQENLINRLPPEILIEIFSTLTANDILTCRLVCSAWRDSAATLLTLRTKCKPIIFRSDKEIKYFLWLMRTTPGTKIPFSKFTFYFEHDTTAEIIEEFLQNYGAEVCKLSIQFSFPKKLGYRISSWIKKKGTTWGVDYAQAIGLLLFNTANLISLSLLVLNEFVIPDTTESNNVATFPNLKKFKLKFMLNIYEPRLKPTDQLTLFEKVIKNANRLQVLSLHYYPYFCSTAYKPMELTMLTTELKKLPSYLRLLCSSSIKVKLRLGIITNKFQNIFNQLVALDPQPRIVALAISLPPELDLALKTPIWKWIQTLPLYKLKFFHDYSHYADIPDLPTNPFYTVHQLRLTCVTGITSNNAHLLFPNVKRLTVRLRSHMVQLLPQSLSQQFQNFQALILSLPNLEYLRLTGMSWEVLALEPPRDHQRTDTLNYVLQQIENFEEGKCAAKSPIWELKKLRCLEIDLRNDGMFGALYASGTGKLQRLPHLIFKKYDEHRAEPKYFNESVAAKAICKYHDKVEFINEFKR